MPGWGNEIKVQPERDSLCAHGGHKDRVLFMTEQIHAVCIIGKINMNLP